MALGWWLGRASLGMCVAFAATGIARAEVDDSPSTDPSYTAYVAQQAAWEAMDQRAGVDYGAGVGRGKPRGARAAMAALSASAPGVPVGGTDAGTNGYYAPPVTWPGIPIHMAMLPDGRVMSFGTNSQGVRFSDTKLYFDVWDPTLGTGTDAHMQVGNGTSTDIFCSYQTLLAATGDLLTVGGDLRPEKKPNASTNAVTVFAAPTNTLSSAQPMVFPRWYGTVVEMPSGDLVAMGGRQRHAGSVTISAPTPEVMRPGAAWQALGNATSDAAFFAKSNWFYPRAIVAPNGLIYLLGMSGDTYWLDPAGQGTLTPIAKMVPAGDSMPIAMFAPGKVLSLRSQGRAYVIDLNGASPVVTQTGSPSQVRQWSNTTVLADGTVLLNGGSVVSNDLKSAVKQNEIWNPVTGVWSPTGAVASIPRLYHSTALLLPDATVVTAGGGTPGPVKELNAEIFYPPYLYLNDGSGNPAPRPLVRVVGSSIFTVGQSMTVEFGASDQIGRLTLVKFGAVTHALNTDQRFFDLPFQAQANQRATATLPASANVLTPGFYMVFAVNSAGTPSVAATIQVLPTAAQRAAAKQANRQTATAAANPAGTP